jgi:hypothetical protein
MAGNSKALKLNLRKGKREASQERRAYHSGTSDVTIIFKNDLMKEKHGTFGQ